MPAIKLTAEEAVEMARAAAFLAGCKHDMLVLETPDEVRALHAGLTPYAELIRELQEKLEVTMLDLLRDVATHSHTDALDEIASWQTQQRRYWAGDSDWYYEGASQAETIQITAHRIEEHLDQAAIAESVLKRIEGVA